ALHAAAPEVRRQLVLDGDGGDHPRAAPGDERRTLGVRQVPGRDLDGAQLRGQSTFPGRRPHERSPSSPTPPADTRRAYQGRVGDTRPEGGWLRSSEGGERGDDGFPRRRAEA